jgi:hypothetical protein
VTNLKDTNAPLKWEQEGSRVSGNNQPRTYHKVPQANKVCSVFYLFCEEIHQIGFTFNMTNTNKVIRNIFPHMVFFHLDVPQSFHGTIIGPIDTSFIIIVDCVCSGQKDISDIEELKQLYKI